MTGERVTGFDVVGLGVANGLGRLKVGAAVLSGNPNISNTFLKFSFRFSFIVTFNVQEQLGLWQPMVNILLTVSMNESSTIPLSTKEMRLSM